MFNLPIIRTLRVLRENKQFVKILESAINGVQAMWVFLVVWARHHHLRHPWRAALEVDEGRNSTI